MMFTLDEAMNIESKIIKERVNCSSKYYPFNRLFNKVRKFSIADKGKAMQTLKQLFIRHDNTKFDKALER